MATDIIKNAVPEAWQPRLPATGRIRPQVVVVWIGCRIASSVARMTPGPVRRGIIRSLSHMMYDVGQPYLERDESWMIQEIRQYLRYERIIDNG